ncbi:MAG: hypothetical protein WC342_10455 [Methanoregula sp.]|jgi:hypothetical protein
MQILIMQYARYLIVLILGAAILAGGCTQDINPSKTNITTTITTVPASLEAYALTPSEIPPGFIQTENRKKDPSEVSQLAQDLGWQAGYVVQYFNSSDKITDTNSIIQTITIYPEKNIPDIISVSEKQVRTDPNMTYTVLPVTGFGDTAIAMKGTPISQLVVQPESGLFTGISSLSNSDTTATASFQRETRIIFFSKGDVFEVLQVKGSSINQETFLALAATAYAKLT